MNRRLFIGGCLGLCTSAVTLPSALKWSFDQGNLIEMKLRSGTVTIDLFPDLAPNHVERIKLLVHSKFYDDMPFSRVIEGFMAQTGIPRKNIGLDYMKLPKLNAEFNDLPFERGTIGMARSINPHSACHQFFITSVRSFFLDRNYTVVGKVKSGMELIDQLRRGNSDIGTVVNPDVIKNMRLVNV